VVGDYQTMKPDLWAVTPVSIHTKKGSGRSGSRNHTFRKLDGFLKSMGLTSTPSTVECNRQDRPKIFLPDAEIMHQSRINTVERDQTSKRPTMKNTVLKRRSINLDENSYQQAKLLAQDKGDVVIGLAANSHQ
jgi:hypothetical protein